MGAVHASCVVLGEDGILIRGPAGSGKSTLVRDLIRLGAISGVFAALVGDDRVALTLRHGRLVAAPHPALAGLLEIRGLGLQPVDATMPSAVLRLVVDLAETAPGCPRPPRRRFFSGGWRCPGWSCRRTRAGPQRCCGVGAASVS